MKLLNRPDIKDYAEQVCSGMNNFLASDDVIIVRSDTRLEDDETYRLTFTLIREGDSPPEEVPYNPPEEDTYDVEDNGEHLTFACQDEQHIHIKSNAEDWSKFDVTEHTGEAISCAIDSRKTA